jgi:dihydrodiol dehydrogenase / D-xylose 1-dehydrogenase (NADP)
MWTRFFPAVEEARRLIHEERLLGDVLSVTSDFHFQASDSDEYPTSFLYQHALGGGATFLVAPYPLAMVTAFFPSSSSSSSNNNNANKDNSDISLENVTTTTTTKIHAVGQVDSATGVDLQVAAVVSFTPTSPANATTANSTSATPVVPGAGLAMITYGMLGESNEETIVIGTKGRLTIRNPCHCPTRLTIRLKGDGRGQATQEYDLHFPLPDETPEIIEAGGFVYPNSAGFVYEAAAVMRCIASGQVEAPQYTWSDTLWNMARMDEIRWQLGVQPLREQEDDDEEEEN